MKPPDTVTRKEITRNDARGGDRRRVTAGIVD